jgi:hypothetical protein
MPRFISFLLGTILVICFLASSALSPTVDGISNEDQLNPVLEDIVADYELYSSLLHDVYYENDYLITNHANTLESASAYLAKGFDQTLAQSMAGYYLKWLPELNKLAVIPTDSIPIISSVDRAYLNMQRISPDKVIIERVYTDCYEPGDKYLYSILAVFKGGHWIISNLQLIPLYPPD